MPVHSLLTFVATALLAAGLTQPLLAQHCPPIYEAFLSAVTLKRAKTGKLNLAVDLTVNGGPGQKAYQAYVIAYLDRDAGKVPAPPTKDLLDPEFALVLHTQVIRQNDDGVFPLRLELEGDALAKKVIRHRKLGEKDRTAYGGWGIYKDRIRLAVFVPFLDDEKYSVLDGLPEDRHYCNYDDDRALLFQQLPYRLSMNFGIVRARTVKDGTLVVQIHGDRPPK
ncbi:MAG: hypothetical protein NXI31_13255 [bacterium]|nr:hypothetical protein [bacterium]